MGVCHQFQPASRVAFALERKGRCCIWQQVCVLSPISCSWIKDMASRMCKELLAIPVLLRTALLRAFVGWWGIDNPVQQHVRFLRLWIGKHTITSLHCALFLEGV